MIKAKYPSVFHGIGKLKDYQLKLHIFSLFTLLSVQFPFKRALRMFWSSFAQQKI